MPKPLLVVNYRDVVRGFADCERQERLAMRKVLRQAGEAVRRGAAGRIAPKDGKTAGGYRVYVRQRGVGVEQSLRRTTGRHPGWGSYQMRHALLPAVSASEEETLHAVEHALDVIADTFNHGGAP